MSLKRNSTTLSISREKTQESFALSDRLISFFAGLWILLGLWLAGQQLCPSGSLWLLLAIVAMAAILIPRWNTPKTQGLAMGLFAVGLLLCFLLHDLLLGGIAAIGSSLRDIYTQKTGYYYAPYVEAAWNSGTAAFFSCLLGIVTGVAIRMWRGILHFCFAILLTAWILYLAPESSFWLLLYLTGTLLLQIKDTSGSGRTPFAALLLVLLAAIPVLLWNPVIKSGTLSQWLTRQLHHAIYEPIQNPLPEGNLQNLPAFSASDEAALTLQTDASQAIYLRGFVADVYTDIGWEKAAPYDSQYTLQKHGFFAATEYAGAAVSLQKNAENQIRVQTNQACKAYCYIPYGISSDAFDPRALQTEQLDSDSPLSGVIFDISKAYLLQAELGARAERTEFTDAEALYRDQVLLNCLQLPTETYEALAKRFPLPRETISTAQARELVQAWVNDTLTYDESVSGPADLRNFTDLLTNHPRGYCVQYATLTTLLLRYCGIPARYVEGYFVDADDARSGDRTVVLTQKNAHAWAEFYLDGIGWLPLDTTPIHKNAICYEMPPNDNVQNPEILPLPEQDETPQDIPIQRDSTTNLENQAVTHLAQCLWLVVLILILLFVLRTLLLRKKLRHEQSLLQSGCGQKAISLCLRYAWRILEDMGLSAQNIPMTQQSDSIALLLQTDPAPVREALSFAEAFLFSNHPISEEDWQAALRILSAVQAAWKQHTSPWHRFFAKWIRCNIY